MRAFGRSLSDFGTLFELEKQLLAACQKGGVAQGDVECPEHATTQNKVRAGFLRFLLLGAEDGIAIHENGIQLGKAFIVGALDLRSATVAYAFTLRSCTLTRITAFSGAQFKQTVNLHGSHLKGLKAYGMSVRGDFIATNIQTLHAVNIDSVSVGGEVNFSGALFKTGSNMSLSATDAIIRGGLFLTDGFTAEGLVRVVGAEVGGQFNCRAGTFLNEKVSLDAGNIKVGRGVFLVSGFKSFGELSFIAATVSAQFALRGAKLACKNGMTLRADRIRVNGNIYLDSGFTSEGTVSLSGAVIQGQLNCTGGVFTGDGNALLANSVHVTGAAHLGGGFSSEGTVSFNAARFDSDLIFSGAEGVGKLVANRVRIKGSLNILKVKNPLNRVSLAGAHTTALNDDAASWGKHLVLNGFVYEFLDVHNTMTVNERVVWLGKQCIRLPATVGKLAKAKKGPPAFVPQPWLQLKTVLENMGRAEDAREIGIEYERHRSKCGQIGLAPQSWDVFSKLINRVVAKALHGLYGILISYGYRPILLMPWFLGVWILTTAFYWYAANQGAVFAPSDPLIFQNDAYAACRPPSVGPSQPGTGNWYLCDALPQEYTGFSPIAFSLDLLLPLVDLHQEKDWAPLIETPKANVKDELLGFFSLKRAVRFVMWFEILAGWGFSLLFVVIVSGLARAKEK
ncbi:MULTISPECIES: membrane-associated oxidoreductase [unclassified Pseudomonas]|uniref:membrane-associated oxidoreductase n=1 Tax=unclassified Pseudomonas TaxID=196821 RepID=UPI00385C79F5